MATNTAQREAGGYKGSRIWRKRMLDEGRCTGCGEDRDEDGFLMCGKCRHAAHPNGRKRKREDARVKLARRVALRESRIAAGMCTGCGKEPPCDPSRNNWCESCRDRKVKQNNENRAKVREEYAHMRPAMVEMYGDPTKVWKDNVCRDDVSMRVLVNPLRAQRTLDSWLREC